jgi:acyl-CoA reductase-like NAD-dependent aldehyde dehydrogenase
MTSTPISTSTDAATLEAVTGAAKAAAAELARTTTEQRADWLRAVAHALDAAVDDSW